MTTSERNPWPARDEGYSSHVEIDHDGLVKWSRDVAKGEVVSVPMHMMEQIFRQSRDRR